jgi:hypothetical protein
MASLFVLIPKNCILNEILFKGGETMELLIWLFTFDNFLLLIGVVLPMLIGYSITLSWLYTKYWEWVWKGMDNERRYALIRIFEDNSYKDYKLPLW